MQKGYLSSNQMDSVFQPQASDNPQNAEVAENLSGTAQQLKSADNSMAYKNLNGSNIEDTTLVQDSHIQTIQTDWNDNYDSGVTSNVTETAPSISQNLTLTQSISNTTSSLNETINTATDNRVVNTPQWESYHNSLQTSIPTNLQTTLSTSGAATTNSLQSQVGAQNLTASSYNHNFGSLTSNGNTSLNGTSSINGANINIGPGGNTSNIDFTLQRDAGKLFPTTSGQLFSEDLEFPPIPTQRFLVKGNLNMEGTLDAQSTVSVNPVSFDQDGASLDLTKTVNEYFDNMQISSVSDSDPTVLPEVEISFNQGTITFTSSMGVKTSASSQGYMEVIYTHPPINIAKSDYLDWELDMTVNVTLTAKFYPTVKPESGLQERADVFAQLFWQGLQQEFEIAKPYLPYAIPEEAPIAAGAKGLLPIVLRLGPMVFKATRGLEHAYN